MNGREAITLGQCESRSAAWLNGDYVAAPGPLEGLVREHLERHGLSSSAVWCEFRNMATYHYLIFPTGTLPRLLNAMRAFA
jgi:hypothetical protein